MTPQPSHQSNVPVADSRPTALVYALERTLALIGREQSEMVAQALSDEVRTQTQAQAARAVHEAIVRVFR